MKLLRSYAAKLFFGGGGKWGGVEEGMLSLAFLNPQLW